MNPINTPPIPTGVNAATPAATPSMTPSAASADASPVTILAAHFSHYHVIGDGDCLFRAMHMGLVNQPGVEPREEQVMGLRQYLANYVYQHQDTLAHHPAFEGRQGVLNLYDLLLTPGQWNHNAGDLVAPLLAQVSGRPLAVLQPTQEGLAYSVRQVFPAENPTLPAGLAHTGEPIICLSHINGNHYGYLEERYPNVLRNALNQQPQNTPQPELNPVATPPLEVESMDTTENNPSKYQKGKKRLSEAQEEVLKQFWLANPRWGERKLSHEFNRQYPGMGVTRDVVNGLKRRNPILFQIGIGSSLVKKKNNGVYDDAFARFWRDNPGWGIVKIANEFNKDNPGVNFTSGDVRRVKTFHPDLKGLKLGGEKKIKVPFDNDQKQALLDLWRNNPTWSHKQVVNEFKKLKPGVRVPHNIVQRIKASHPEMQEFNLGPGKSLRKLNDEKVLELLQLWRANPKWGYQKIANEYNKHNPGMNISHAYIHRIKTKHPSFRGLKLGSQKTQKKLNDAQEKMLVELWQKNPGWSHRKVSSEFNQRNPSLHISPIIVWSLKLNHPALQGLDLGLSGRQLSDQQEKDLVQLWRNNPSWGKKKVAYEFLKQNPNAYFTESLARELRVRHPDLRELNLGSNRQRKKLNNEQERDLLQFWRRNSHLSERRLVQEYMARNPGVSISRNLLYRLKLRPLDLTTQGSMPFANTRPFDIPEDDILTPRTLSVFNDLFTVDDLIDQPIRDNRATEEDTLSQSTFAALSDIVGMDDLSDEQYLSSHTSGDDSSQGTFDGLEDFEDMSPLRE